MGKNTKNTNKYKTANGKKNSKAKVVKKICLILILIFVLLILIAAGIYGNIL